MCGRDRKRGVWWKGIEMEVMGGKREIKKTKSWVCSGSVRDGEVNSNDAYGSRESTWRRWAVKGRS